jgi:TPR repeat protein
MIQLSGNLLEQKSRDYIGFSMIYENKSKVVFFLIISSILVNDYLTMLAMEYVVESQDLVAGKKFWPYYVETKPECREFFVIKPFRPSPQTLHMYGYHCSGHKSQDLYETCISSIPQLMAQTESAKYYNDDKLILHLMACARLLSAYQDATCSCMPSGIIGLEEKLDLLATIIKIFPEIDTKICARYHCKEIFDDAISIVIKYAREGDERSLSLLKGIFTPKSKVEYQDFMSSVLTRSALELCACDDDQLNTTLQKFLYKKGTAQEKKKAYEYFARKMQQGDLEASCYYAHGKILNSDYAGALIVLTNLFSSEQGRDALPIFEQLCDARTLQILGVNSKKRDKDAAIILGIIFNLRKDYLRAFSLLNCCVEGRDLCPYIYYSLACLFKNGYGKDEKFSNAINFFVKAITVGADSALCHDIEFKLHEIEDTGNIGAFCELLFLKSCDQVKCQEVKVVLDSCKEAAREKYDRCFDYMLKRKFFDRLEKEATKGKPGAMYLLSQVYYVKGLTAKEKATVEFDRAFLTLNQVQSLSVLDVREELGRVALDIALYYLKIDDDKKALWYAQKAVDYKAKDAERILSQIRMYSSTATEKDMAVGATTLLKYAEECDDKSLCEIAETFIFTCKAKNGVQFPRDIQRGYELIKKLLERSPENAGGLYMLGRLLYEYGGQGNIPVDENRAQECLKSALEKKCKLQPIDFINIACTSYKKAEYTKAFEWIEKATCLPSAKLYKGIFYLTVPAVYLPVDEKDRDEKALSCFEESLYELNLIKKDYFFCYVQEHENFIDYIKNKAQQNDYRFMLVLLRFASIYGLDMVGIDKETAIRYLDIVLQNKVPSADSFCASLYCTGTWLEKSEERAFGLSKKVLDFQKLPAYITHEALATLVKLSNLGCNRFGVMACYELSRYFLNDPEHKKLVLDQFSRAECGLKICINGDKELYEYARKTGLWDIMLAKARYDEELALCMGICYAERLKWQPDMRWLNEIEAKGMHYIEKIANTQYVSDMYIVLADALAVAGADKTRCAILLRRACEIKPENIIALVRLSELFGGRDADCVVLHSKPHVQLMLQAIIEFEKARLARTQKLKEDYCDAMKRGLLLVIDQVQIEHGCFVEEQINNEFNQFLKALEKAGAQDQYLQDIFIIIIDRLKAKGFIRS